MTVQSTSSATCWKNAAPSPFSRPLKISRTRSDVMLMISSPLFSLIGPERLNARGSLLECFPLAPRNMRSRRHAVQYMVEAFSIRFGDECDGAAPRPLLPGRRRGEELHP